MFAVKETMMMTVYLNTMKHCQMPLRWTICLRATIMNNTVNGSKIQMTVMDRTGNIVVKDVKVLVAHCQFVEYLTD